jgi:VanZ family protein
MKRLTSIFPITSLFFTILTISVLSLIPPESGVQLKEDKWGHFLAYLILTGNALYLTSNIRQRLIACASIFAYGALIELIQRFIPGREASFLDLLANFFGMLLGSTFDWIIRKHNKIKYNLKK